MIMKQVLVILRGAPSSGKSTIAKAIRNYHEKIIWLKVDNFKTFFSDDSDLVIDDANLAAVDSLRYFLGKGFSVIMEGIFQDPQYVRQAVDVAKKNNIGVKVYQLDCSLATLQKRDKEREGIALAHRKKLGDETIAKLFEDLRLNPYQGAINLDTERLSLNQCIDEIRNNFIG